MNEAFLYNLFNIQKLCQFVTFFNLNLNKNIFYEITVLSLSEIRQYIAYKNRLQKMKHTYNRPFNKHLINRQHNTKSTCN